MSRKELRTCQWLRRGRGRQNRLQKNLVQRFLADQDGEFCVWFRGRCNWRLGASILESAFTISNLIRGILIFGDFPECVLVID